tara:strand:- start:446 stop:664 length:219 start_codon:yes stop_codon:yes gene_type:complete
MYLLQNPETYYDNEYPLMDLSILEMLGLLFLVGLSFVFHLLVYGDDYIKKWYWKIIVTVLILGFILLALMGY